MYVLEAALSRLLVEDIAAFLKKGKPVFKGR